ncbi:MAG TPA: hypothetical protein VMW27_27010 [Thermoanaerobaculia bacterium]|nr:hypothetical protein [Thermoanaerobaculia bacterium]
MVAFVSTLAIGAVAGWMLEQQFGKGMVRWYRQRMMQARVARRQGMSPFEAWRERE